MCNLGGGGGRPHPESNTDTMQLLYNMPKKVKALFNIVIPSRLVHATTCMLRTRDSCSLLRVFTQSIWIVWLQSWYLSIIPFWVTAVCGGAPLFFPMSEGFNIPDQAAPKPFTPYHLKFANQGPKHFWGHGPWQLGLEIMLFQAQAMNIHKAGLSRWSCRNIGNAKMQNSVFQVCKT